MEEGGHLDIAGAAALGAVIPEITERGGFECAAQRRRVAWPGQLHLQPPDL